MRTAAPALALALTAGCQATRVAELQAEIVELSAEIEETEALVAKMQAQLDRHRAATDHPDPAERMPPDHNPARPLPPGDPQRPDILLLSVDTLRADHLGAWGYARGTSPHFDQLAAEGTRFADTWSPSPWTLPSHTTLLSGLLPPTHGAIEDDLRIGDDVPMVQEAFQAQGWATAGVVATLFVSRRFGFDRGFDWFHDFDVHDTATNNAATVDADHVFTWALDWAQDLPEGKPAFVFLHVYDAHYAYNAPPPWDEKFDRKAELGDALYRDYQYYKRQPLPQEQLEHQVAQYDEEIAYVDDAFARFLATWRSTRPAIVVITADHGEEFGERGSWGHAHTLFPEQLHVPLIVNGPGVRRQVVAQRVGTEDLATTIASLGGVSFGEGDGVDRAAQIRGGGAPRDGVAGRFASTSRFETLRYRWHEPPWDLTVDLAHAKRGLCNLETDPSCTLLAPNQDRERADAMFAAMLDWLGFPWEAARAGRVEVDGGVLYDDDGNRYKHALTVSAGDRFAVHPGDATVRFVGANGDLAGPWAALGGDLPEGNRAPLLFHGRRPVTNTSIQLTEAEQQMLEALGYLQDK